MPETSRLTAACHGLFLRGRKALTLAQYEHGTLLLSDSGGGFDLVQAHVVAVSPDEAPADVWTRLQTSLVPIAPVIRICNENYWERTTVADLRSGLITAKGLAGHELRKFMLSLLPLPEELK